MTIIGLIAVVTLGSGLLAGCHHRGPHKGADFMMDYLTEALDLNEDQQAMAEGFKDEVMVKVKAMQSDKKEFFQEIKNQLSSETMDTGRIKALVAEHKTRMNEVTDLVVDRVAELHATLSQEQRDKLVDKLEKFEGRRQCKWAD